VDLSDGDGDGDEVEDLDVMVAAQAPSDADAPVQAARRRLFAQARENVVSVDSESDFASLHEPRRLAVPLASRPCRALASISPCVSPPHTAISWRAPRTSHSLTHIAHARTRILQEVAQDRAAASLSSRGRFTVALTATRALPTPSRQGSATQVDASRAATTPPIGSGNEDVAAPPVAAATDMVLAGHNTYEKLLRHSSLSRRSLLALSAHQCPGGCRYRCLRATCAGRTFASTRSIAAGSTSTTYWKDV